MRKAFSARRQGWRRLVSSGAAVLGVLRGMLLATASVEAVTDAASAAPTSLGTTPAVFGYNEYSSIDSSLGSPSGTSIAGTLVVGGDLDVPTGDTLSVGTGESGSTVLDVAGNLTGAGTLCVGGTHNQGKCLGTSTVQPGSGCGGLGEPQSTALRLPVHRVRGGLDQQWLGLDGLKWDRAVVFGKSNADGNSIDPPSLRCPVFGFCGSPDADH